MQTCCSVKWNNELLSQQQRWQRVREVEHKSRWPGSYLFSFPG